MEEVGNIPCIIIRDTKNRRQHYIPITEQIQKILKSAENATDYLFPSTQKKDRYMEDVRPTLERLSKAIGMEFKCHDLRRTFATRASEVGIDFLMIKRMLNHRSNDIAAQYIRWNSKENLKAMRVCLDKVIYSMPR